MESPERKTLRHEYLSSVNTFIKSSGIALEDFTRKIGWTKPPDRSKIPKRIEKVSEVNSINEYSEEPLLPSFPSSVSRKFSIKIDSEKQKTLLPHRKNVPDLRQPPSSVGELTVNFTLEERLILYEHTLNNATPMPTPPELLPMEVGDSFESQPKELSGLELMKAMRDFKRRRQAYRTKVSTKNKSQIEVTREIIHNMMGLLGMEEPESDMLSIPNRLHPPSSSPDGDSDLTTLDKRAEFTTTTHKVTSNSFLVRDIKHPEKRQKRSELEHHSRSRTSRESVKHLNKNTCHDMSRFLSKDENLHRKVEKNLDVKCRSRRTPDKYQSGYKDTGSSQSRQERSEENNYESDYKEHDHRKLKRNKKDKYGNERRHDRYESFPRKSHKREKSEKKKRDEY